jgi:hypothetical protein
MIQCLLIICAFFLCTTSAAYAGTDASDPVPASSSMFPAADMSLKLAFDLAPPALLAPHSEQCFPFFPNAPFQGWYCISFFSYKCFKVHINAVNKLYSGGTVLMEEGASMMQLSPQSAAAGSHDATPPDLFVTIRFQSTKADSVSCLHIGGPSRLQELDCASAVEADWQWERVASPTGGGMSLVHTMSTLDVAAIVQEGNPRAEQWDVCVASSAPEMAASQVRGTIKLFQHKGAAAVTVTPGSPVDGAGAERGGLGTEGDLTPPPSSAREHRHAARPPQKHSERAPLAVSGWAQVARQGDRQARSDGLVASAETPDAVDIYVDSLVDEAANTSLCDSSHNQSSTPTGQCNLRSAVASCEALLTAPATALCSVHLPPLSDIAMAPALGELHVQDFRMKGALSIIGNGCHIAPNATASSSMRFMRVDGNDKFAFRMSNLSLFYFGNMSMMNGGAMHLENLLSEDASSIEDVNFVGNVGFDGGALFVNQCLQMIFTSCTFTNNTATDDGGGMYVYGGNDAMTFASCTFTDNNAADNGGGMYVNLDNDDMSLTSCTFIDNTANIGGGLHLNSGNTRMTLTSCSFKDNTAIVNGGGLFVSSGNFQMMLSSCILSGNTAYYTGGGIYVNSDNYRMTLTSCTFRENNAVAYGGGMFVYSDNNDMALTSCNFTGNTANNGVGLSVYTNNDDMTLTSCTFSENSAADNGGGMFAYIGNDDMTLTSCAFIENTAADNGGGMYVYNDNVRLRISSCTFAGNAVFNKGGGMYVSTDQLGMTLTSCTFSGNMATVNGGSLYVHGGNDFLALSSCTFTDNTANFGGGVYVHNINDDVTITSCIFIGNTADVGGGVYVHNDNVGMTLTSCTFSGNIATDDGGGMYVYNGNDDISLSSCTFAENTATSHGGGVYVYFDNVGMTFTSCTFSKNTASSDGGGLFMNSDNYDVVHESCVFTENVAEGNGGGMYVSSNNWDMQLVNATFSSNIAVSGNGGALTVAFYNFHVVVSESQFFHNVAGVSGKHDAPIIYISAVMH